MIELKRRPNPQAEASPESDTDRELNAAIHSTFDTPNGQKVLSYLYNTTIASIAGPGITSNELFYKEGMRITVAKILERFEKGKKLV